MEGGSRLSSVTAVAAIALRAPWWVQLTMKTAFAKRRRPVRMCAGRAGSYVGACEEGWRRGASGAGWNEAIGMGFRRKKGEALVVDR